MTEEEKRQTLDKIIGLVANAPLKNHSIPPSPQFSGSFWPPEVSSETSLVSLFTNPIKADDYNIIEGKKLKICETVWGENF